MNFCASARENSCNSEVSSTGSSVSTNGSESLVRLLLLLLLPLLRRPETRKRDRLEERPPNSPDTHARRQTFCR